MTFTSAFDFTPLAPLSAAPDPAAAMDLGGEGEKFVVPIPSPWEEGTIPSTVSIWGRGTGWGSDARVSVDNG